MEKEKLVTPAEYFDKLKTLKNQNTDESLNEFYEASLVLMNKYKLFKQKKMIKKLMFIIECVPKEKQLLDLGVNTFIYKDDIEEYINSVEGKAVKIIEMENYPRDIPEELAPIIEKTTDIFDEFYILFTDYNGREEKKIAKERREKDPILFGVFKNSSTMNDRFYYLGDWIDEYCDLTLEKLLSEAGTSIIRNTKIPTNKEELINECNKLIENNGSFITEFSNNTYLTRTITSSTPTSTIVNVIAPPRDNDGREN